MNETQDVREVRAIAALSPAASLLSGGPLPHLPRPDAADDQPVSGWDYLDSLPLAASLVAGFVTASTTNEVLLEAAAMLRANVRPVNGDCESCRLVPAATIVDGFEVCGACALESVR
jgi:hypothetical protein